MRSTVNKKKKEKGEGVRTKQNSANKLSGTDVGWTYTNQHDGKQSDSGDCYDLCTYSLTRSLWKWKQTATVWPESADTW